MRKRCQVEQETANQLVASKKVEHISPLYRREKNIHKERPFA